jgi:uncharacterized protein DUF4157
MRQFARQNVRHAAASTASLARAQPLARASSGRESWVSDARSESDRSRAPAVAPSPLPASLRLGMEMLSGVDLSGVRVHHNSRSPADWSALAYTQGRDIHLASGAEPHLPHEAWHAVQQLSGRARPGAGGGEINDDPALEAEADRMGARAASAAPAAMPPALMPPPNAARDFPIQRLVRTGSGKTKIDETEYQTGAKKAVGTRVKVKDLIADATPRAFTDTAELDSFANGTTDYIGDVKTASAGTYWYRLPPKKLTVLGEKHHDPMGNFEDVVVGLHTQRFKYEPFNEAVDVAGVKTPDTKKRIGEVNKQYDSAKEVKAGSKFKPELENVVIKAMTGAALAREFIGKSPATMSAAKKKEWVSRPSLSAYSGGERAALYFTLGIHIAKDLAAKGFGKPSSSELPVTTSGRKLADIYTANKADLDALMTKKDGDDLIGIYELTEPGSFKVLPVVKDFAVAMHEYGSRYIQQLGTETGNKDLVKEGKTLEGNASPGLMDFNPAREAIMWTKIQQALVGGYMLVGMGNTHRTDMAAKLKKLGVEHEFVPDSLERQKDEVKKVWVT